MKTKSAAVLCVAAAMLLGGCSDSESVSRESTVSVPRSAETESVDAPQSVPNGEPTFLIGADGVAIYTSEITEVMISDPESPFGEREISVEELDESTFSSVTCGGFAYCHDSRINVNDVEEPDKFENGVYIGEELPPAAEYRRLRTGDKVGGLTVRAAETVFTRESELAANGSWLGWSSVYFDGELTVTGYITITENPLYQDGMVRLMPIDSPIPPMIYQYSEETGISHIPVFGDGYYSETAEINLGYLEGINADMDGLKTGDRNVKVRAVIGNVRAGGGTFPSVFGDLLRIEKI